MKGTHGALIVSDDCDRRGEVWTCRCSAIATSSMGPVEAGPLHGPETPPARADRHPTDEVYGKNAVTSR